MGIKTRMAGDELDGLVGDKGIGEREKGEMEGKNSLVIEELVEADRDSISLRRLGEWQISLRKGLCRVGLRGGHPVSLLCSLVCQRARFQDDRSDWGSS